MGAEIEGDNYFHEPVKRIHVLNHQHQVTSDVRLRVDEMAVLKKERSMILVNLAVRCAPEPPSLVDANEIARLNRRICVCTFLVIVIWKKIRLEDFGIIDVDHGAVLALVIARMFFL